MLQDYTSCLKSYSFNTLDVPLVVSLSLIIKDPILFPEASSCLSASFLLTPLKNHLKTQT